jgi:hypothetical protein
LGGIDGIWEGQGKKRNPIKLLYALKSTVQVPARFGFVSTVKKVVTERIARQFTLAWQTAIAMMR